MRPEPSSMQLPLSKFSLLERYSCQDISDDEAEIRLREFHSIFGDHKVLYELFKVAGYTAQDATNILIRTLAKVNRNQHRFDT